MLLIQQVAERPQALPSAQRLGAVLALLLLLCGCSSHIQRLQKSRQHFLSGELLAAEESLQQQLERKSRDQDVLALDLAMVQLCQGQPQAAEQTLRLVRDRFDYLEQKDVRDSVTSLFTDDQRRAYAGEDYEKVLIRVFLALSNLMHDRGDVESYSLQIAAKQQALFDRRAQRTNSTAANSPALPAPTAPTPGSLPPGYDPHVIPAAAQMPVGPESLAPPFPAPLAIGPYLRGVLQESTHRHYDDAQRSYSQVVQLAPQFPFGPADCQRASTGAHSQPGNGVIYVIGLVDRGPVKVETAAQATSDALLIADRILSAVGKHELPPTIAPVKIPTVEVPTPGVSHLQVFLNRALVGETATICDIGELAVQYDELNRSDAIARAVVRRVAKKSAVYVAQDQLANSNPLASLAMTAAGVAWEATESADTRCWGLLPRTIQVTRIELPAGRYQLQLAPVSYQRQLGPPVPCSVQVHDGRNAYVLAYFPGARPIGKVLVSE